MGIFAQGRIRLHDLVTARLPITEWRTAFDLCRDRKGLKVVMHPVA
jgi:threonine dehydrogenase-like Zn-dependent dehydrogenase